MKIGRDKYIEKFLLLNAMTTIIIIFSIFFFVSMKGLPIISKLGFWHFLTGRSWQPENNEFGLLPMITGTLYVTAGSLLIGVPIGIGCALFLAEIGPGYITRVIRSAIELLAGIPPVVYGFYGLMVLVPMLRSIFGGTGFSILSGAMVLAIMILPTIVIVSEGSIRAVSKEFKEGSYALGATQWQTIKKVILPASRNGIITATILGMGRAMGETMAMILVTGNVAIIPGSALDPLRTLTANIAIETGYASGEHASALFASGIMLFVFIIALNLIAMIPQKAGD